MPPLVTRALVERLPKTDLHLHLDGSIRPVTLIELAREYGVALPSWTEEGLGETVFRPSYDSLEEYLRGFSYTCAVLQDRDALERVAFELAEDNQAEGVRYIEVRFAPQLHARDGFDAIDAIAAVNAGLDRAKRAFNRRPEVAWGPPPPIAKRLIVGGRW
jgi:adenosine deaminase